MKWMAMMMWVLALAAACDETDGSENTDTHTGPLDASSDDLGESDTGVAGQDTAALQDTALDTEAQDASGVDADTQTADATVADTADAGGGQDTSVAADTADAGGGQDTSVEDTSAPVEDPADWTQCTTHADCVTALGWDLATCNTDWPGGRCTCNDNQAADTCFQLGNGANIPVCAGDLAVGFFCTYESFPGQECPDWLRKRFFVGDDYCLLQTCTVDDDCGVGTPFVCRSLGGGVGTTYCQNPE